MDELEAVQQLLAERPPPAPDVVAAARTGLERAGVVSAPGAFPVHLNGAQPVAGPGTAVNRRWRGWLAPVAAAAAVAVVIAISVAIASTVGSRAHQPATSTPAVFAQVPRYFVVLKGHGVPYQGERAEVVATATGAVLGSVSVPRAGTVFSEVSAAADDRVFVLAAQRGKAVGYVKGGHGPRMDYGTGPAAFYKLVLARSGRPAALTALSLPPVTGNLNGFALSPNGTKLAVSVLPSYSPRSGQIAPSRGAQLFVFSLATGAQRAWRLPGPGWIGMDKPNAQSLSWAGDNRTLLFQEHRGAGGGTVQVRLLDTAAPGGSLSVDSTLVPFSAKTLGEVWVMLLSADGTKIITGTATNVIHGGMTLQERRSLQPPQQCRPHGRKAARRLRYSQTPYCQKILKQLSQRMVTEAKEHPITARTYAAYTEFSVRTGKPVGVLGRMQGHGQTGADVDWVSATGGAMIVDGPGPRSTNDNPQVAFGVLAGGTFTPLPPAVQAFGYSATW